MKILVTGSAGFIGFHLTQKLLALGHQVIGVDNLNNYYDPKLKLSRNKILTAHRNYHFQKADIRAYAKLEKIFKIYKPDKICQLAAEVGVRSSLERPKDYLETNVLGFSNVIELAKIFQVKNFVFASSSSVYGNNNNKLPFSEADNIDHPISPYAATKKLDELIAKNYSELYGLPCTGLRFFTVYGPWNRPDMAIHKFTKAILKQEVINLYHQGNHLRDFTYVADIVNGIVSALDKNLRYEIINLGNNKPILTKNFVKIIEAALNSSAKIKFVKKQTGDANHTAADLRKAKKLLNFQPRTDLSQGVNEFVAWYKKYYK